MNVTNAPPGLRGAALASPHRMDALLDPFAARDTLPGIPRPWLWGDATTVEDTRPSDDTTDVLTIDMGIAVRRRDRCA